jgi:uncharacterized protein (TIGR01244 family)
MALDDIRAFLLLPDGTATSGMPRPEHFREIADAGFGTVINLALPTSDNALPNEADLVTRAGMTYVHIPVLFDAPKRADYERFEKVFRAMSDQPVFVHCAANMRVSAFMYLYRVRTGMVPREVAEADLRKIWEPDATWRNFIDSILADVTPDR